MDLQFRISALPGESLESTLSQGNADIHIFFFFIKYGSEIQFLSCFTWHFVNPLILVGRLIAHSKGRLVVVFSLGSSPTVDTENRVKKLQPNINISASGSGYGKPNKTQQKRYFATIRERTTVFLISRSADHLRPEP